MGWGNLSLWSAVAPAPLHYALHERLLRAGFPDEVIAVAVRWYIRFRMILADVVEWLTERGIAVDRSTVHRWVRRYLPLIAAAARPHRQPVGARWRVDETPLCLSGRWVYAYRAINEAG
jgi:transposase-like protein